MLSQKNIHTDLFKFNQKKKKRKIYSKDQLNVEFGIVRTKKRQPGFSDYTANYNIEYNEGIILEKESK